MNKLLSALDGKKIRSLISNKTISGSMIPKVQACQNALKGDVRKTHVIDGRIPHVMLLEVFTEEGIGTEIVK